MSQRLSERKWTGCQANQRCQRGFGSRLRLGGCSSTCALNLTPAWAGSREMWTDAKPHACGNLVRRTTFQGQRYSRCYLLNTAKTIVKKTKPSTAAAQASEPKNETIVLTIDPGWGAMSGGSYSFRAASLQSCDSSPWCPHNRIVSVHSHSGQ